MSQPSVVVDEGCRGRRGTFVLSGPAGVLSRGWGRFGSMVAVGPNIRGHAEAQRRKEVVGGRFGRSLGGRVWGVSVGCACGVCVSWEGVGC
jgi:hypothetical protein